MTLRAPRGRHPDEAAHYTVAIRKRDHDGWVFRTGRTHDPLAMQKVVGSSPIIRSENARLLRWSAPLAASKRIDPPARLFRRPRPEVGAERAGDAALEPLPFALGE